MSLIKSLLRPSSSPESPGLTVRFNRPQPQTGATIPFQMPYQGANECDAAHVSSKSSSFVAPLSKSTISQGDAAPKRTQATSLDGPFSGEGGGNAYQKSLVYRVSNPQSPTSDRIPFGSAP